MKHYFKLFFVGFFLGLFFLTKLSPFQVNADWVFDVTGPEIIVDCEPATGGGPKVSYYVGISGQVTLTSSTNKCQPDQNQNILFTISCNDPSGCQRIERYFISWFDNNNNPLGGTGLKSAGPWPYAGNIPQSAPPEIVNVSDPRIQRITIFTNAIDFNGNFRSLGAQPSDCATATNFCFQLLSYAITANVYEDRSVPPNSALDAGDVPYAGTARIEILNASGTVIQTCDTSGGTCTIPNITGGSNYQVRLASVSDYSTVSQNPIPINNLSSNTTVNFFIARNYNICSDPGAPDCPTDTQGNGFPAAGGIYLDTNDNSTYDAGDTLFTDPVQIRLLDQSGTILQTIDNTRGTYSFQNLVNGTYTVQFVLTSGYKSTRVFRGGSYGANPSNTHTVTVSNADATGYNLLVRGWTIEGTVQIDYNHNLAFDPGEDEYSNGIPVTLSNGYLTAPRTATTDASGNYRFTALRGGIAAYTVDITAATTGYTSNFPGNTDLSPRSVSLGCPIVPFPPVCEPTTVNFNVTPLYVITGNIFIDQDKNQRKNGEPNYSGPATISITNNTPSIPPAYRIAPQTLSAVNGVFTSLPSTLISGRYRVEYLDPPTSDGYVMSYPINISPPPFDIWVGRYDRAADTYKCSTTQGPPALHNDADCFQSPGTPYSGSIQNVNFGITNSSPWFQCQGGDCRSDNGISNYIPDSVIPECLGAYASTTTNSSTTPGVLFSGSTSADFCSGAGYCSNKSSSTQWLVGDGTYPEVYSPRKGRTLATSYRAVLGQLSAKGITPTPLSTITGCQNPASCTLPSDDPVQFPNGVYQVNGDLTLNNPNFRFAANKNYVILVSGTLRIEGNIVVPVGSTAFFSVQGDILVDSSVGVADYRTNCVPNDPAQPTHPGCNVEGIYSTDTSFIVEGSGQPGCYDPAFTKDKRINFAGTIITNAGIGTGGFTNQRDTCQDALYCPAYSFRDRPDFILNAPEILKHKNLLWEEKAP